MTSLKDVVLDTLYFRRTDEAEDCLVRNVAFEDLKLHSIDALPVIEDVILREIGVDFVDLSNHPYHGLNDLLGAYMLLGSRHDCHRSIQFLKQLSAPLQARAIGLIPVYFRKNYYRQEEHETNIKKPVAAPELIQLLEDSTRSTDESIRESGLRALRFYRQ